MKRSALAKLTAFAILSCVALPASPLKDRDDLTKRSLVDLMDIEVTSVSKKEQKMSHAASAVFVITQDDIRLSGATNIPDLLRMVPGVEVAQINSSKWAISVRGFNGQYSNKLLVLIDGRTVYTPTLSGVFWDAQDVPLDSIDRIEVIRGPGATVWGANAVNGVINVITKKAGDTLGGLLNPGVGTSNLGFGTARYGGKLGGNADYRVFVDGFARNHSPDSAGKNGNDDWSIIHGGFRIDATASAQNSITVAGDGHSGTAGELVNAVVSILPPVNATRSLNDRFSGWNLVSRWDHVSSPHSETSLQAYFDRSTRGDTTYGIGLSTFDLDFQHHVSVSDCHDIVWGIGYRVSSDKTLTTSRISFNPMSRTTQLFSTFVQDEITLVPDRVYLSLGVKLERNDYTGFGLLPSARIGWTPSKKNTFWMAVSQAERTPARSDTNIRVNYAALPGPSGLPLLISLFGNSRFKNESLLAFEVGYRSQPTNRVSLDSTVFFNNYHHLASVEPGTPFLETGPSQSYLVIPSSFSNLLYGDTQGFEVFANWKVINRWSLSPGYSFFAAHIHRGALSQDLTDARGTEGGSPRHQAQLRSHVDLPGHWEWNTSAFFVGRLSSLAVPSYTRLDTNLAKQLTERFSITLAMENMLKDRHLEYQGPDSSVASSMNKRSASAKITWQF